MHIAHAQDIDDVFNIDHIFDIIHFFDISHVSMLT